MLETKGLSVAFSGKEVLHKVDLAVQNGAFVSLLGSSGCGKSTLLKTIAGLLQQSSGTVRLGGTCVDALPPHKRGTVIVFQDMRLFPHMTAAENVAYPLRIQGVACAERERIAADLLTHVQLSGLGKRRPHQLSGGQQQRVALARALAAKPCVLLLDEPFSGLDENLREDMRQLVRRLHQEFHMTTMLVTHDRQEALSLSDSIVLMSEGYVLQAGEPRQLYECPASRAVAEYFGDAAFLPGTVSDGFFRCALFTIPCSRGDGVYEAVVRPHALTVRKGTGCTVMDVLYTGDKLTVCLRHKVSGLEIRAQAPMDFALRRGEETALAPLPAQIAYLPAKCKTI